MYDIFVELSIFIVIVIWAVLWVTSIVRVISTEIVCHTVADTEKELVMMCIEED